MIQYKILWTSIIRIVLLTVRRITIWSGSWRIKLSCEVARWISWIFTNSKYNYTTLKPKLVQLCQYNAKWSEMKLLTRFCLFGCLETKTLFDGWKHNFYNSWGYFAGCVAFFWPCGGEENASNKKKCLIS